MWPFTPTWPETTPTSIDTEAYDYIIVGGGTAGCALASRLSQDASVSVLLISRGRINDSWYMRGPFIASALDKDHSDNTQWHSEPDVRWDGNKVYTYTSTALGGASRVNGLMLTRGAPANYDRWAEMGNEEWSFAKCEPFFKMMEDASRCHPGKASRGQDGPLVLRQALSPFKFDDYYRKAAERLGFPICDDANDPDAPASGYFSMDTMIHPVGTRLSALQAYLPPETVRARPGLTICTGAVVTKLEMDEKGVTVTGVRLVDTHVKGTARECVVRVNREVIVCAGTMSSPHILMLSGIGPKEELERHDIPVIHDVPSVGQNLNDHVSFGISLETRVEDSHLQITNPLTLLWHLLLFLFSATGLFAWVTTFNCLWVSSSAITQDMTLSVTPETQNARDTANIPDIELMFIGASFTEAREGFVKGKGFSGIYTTLATPYSRGRVSLASSDPLSQPRMHHPHITDPRDWATARKAARFATHFLETTRDGSYGFPTAWHHAPGMKRGTVEGTWRDATDEDVDAFIRKGIMSTRHVTSTCALGSVLEQDLKVKGVRNLRVADSSVFPVVTSGHTVAPTYMVAERCADFIKREWAGKS